MYLICWKHFNIRRYLYTSTFDGKMCTGRNCHIRGRHLNWWHKMKNLTLLSTTLFCEQQYINIYVYHKFKIIIFYPCQFILVFKNQTKKIWQTFCGIIWSILECFFSSFFLYRFFHIRLKFMSFALTIYGW